MGCTQSKIENEEAVARCKERKRLMKEAVSARHTFAAAHSSYAAYLKNTGAALSDFAQGEVQNPEFDPLTIPSSPITTQQSFEIPPPPPPPPSKFSPLYRAASMPEIKTSKSQSEPVGTIIEEQEEDKELENDGALNVRLRRRRSNRSSGGSSRGGTKEVEEEDGARPPAPPPPLPKSKPETQLETNHPMPPQLHDSALEEYFFPSMENTPGTSLSAAEEVSINKEEIERKEFNEKPSIVKGGKDEVQEPVPMPENVADPPPAPLEAMVVAQTGKSSKKAKQVQVSMTEGKKSVKHNLNLQQIFNELDDHFLKASESAHEVSKMLEATRMHYHSNFADNRGHIDHSARVMRVITWNRSFRGIPNMDGGKEDFDSDGHETHATVLDKLLAWEKKLYGEVKVSCSLLE